MSDQNDLPPVVVQAPIKGWMTAASLGNLNPQFAIALDNFIAAPECPITREGSLPHSTGYLDDVLTLMQFLGAGVAEMYAATNDGIFDATSSGAVGAAEMVLTNGKGHAVNYANSAGQWLVWVNGTDTEKLYDGTTWESIDGVSTPAITGVITSTLNNVAVYRKRLYYLQNGFLGFWYLPVDSIGGAAATYPLGSIFPLGGVAIGIGTWSIDGGDGSDDYLAIASSNGEVAIMSGGDPSAVDDWQVNSVYYVGKPASSDCFQKFGGDLLYLCDAGVFPLSKSLTSATIDRTKTITQAIQPTVVEAVRDFPSPDWNISVFPQRSLVLVNAPLDETVQYVMHTQTAGWSRFTGLAAKCWLNFNGEVYCGIGPAVRKMFTGFDDAGSPIPIRLRTAYNAFGTAKPFQLSQIRPLLLVDSPITYELGIAIDFIDAYIMQPTPTLADQWAIADVSLWGAGALWGSLSKLQNKWQTVASPMNPIATSIQLTAEMTDTVMRVLRFDLRLIPQGDVM